MQEKIKTLEQLSEIMEQLKEKGTKVVQCHGVFDLLHPGHMRHLHEAKRQGEMLVVTLTPDCYVNKGPGRPVFNERLRLEQIASLACVDYVVLNDSPDAVSIIKKIHPHIYVKGQEYQEHNRDITGKIKEEVKAVEDGGGKIYYTGDIVFSSSSLINRYFDADSLRLKTFFDSLKSQFSLETILRKIEDLSTLNVLVVGDAIIDEYQYVQPLGQSGKGIHMTARSLEKETFLGGALIIANHIAEFAGKVTLLTGVGKKCPHLSFIRSALNPRINASFFYFEAYPTLTKKRYVLKDGENITKLFEIYSSNDCLLSKEQTHQAIEYMNRCSHEYDLILVCDFGNGLTNPMLIEALSATPSFLAVNTQTNSGNRGYNVVTHYHRADFISLNEPELRLAAHDRYSALERVAHDIAELLQASEVSVTRGVNGVFYYSSKEPSLEIPALTTHSIDRIGAGDSYFALSALCAAMKYPPLISGFLGSAAAAMGIQIVGNREAIKKSGICKYVTRLYK